MSTKNFEINSSLLADNLQDLINREIDLTPAALARKLGIPTNKITRILNGDVTDPKASTLIQIASCFGITLDQLLGRAPVHQMATSLNPSQLLPVFNVNNISEKGRPTEWYKWVDNEIEGDYFALVVDTDLYEPTFPQNSLLIINKDLEPEDRSFVLLQSRKNSHHSIRKLVNEGDKHFLYPINPKLPVELYDANLYNIVGVILEVHQKLHNKK